MIKVGNSIDIHKFEKGRDLFLGGVKIDYEYGLLGHSDADVVLHSICEAIIGALGLGDIGTHFPDTDPKYKGIDSKVLLKEVVKLMDSHNYRIGNVDVTILCEKPHLKKYKSQMESTVSELLNSNQINIKATRGEGLGFIGRAEGIASICTLLLFKKENE